MLLISRRATSRSSIVFTGLALVMADFHGSLVRTASPYSGQDSFDEKVDYSPTSEKPEALYAASTLEKQANYDISTGEQHSCI